MNIFDPFDSRSEVLLDLSGLWQMALCSKSEPDPSLKNFHWQPTTVPADIDQSQEFNGWVVYQKSFIAPANCLGQEANCELFIGEVGDTAEVFLNGGFVSRHGDFPPSFRYAKHYPLSVPLSRSSLRKGANFLFIKVYSPKKVQVGLRQGPVVIVDGERAAALNKLWVTKRIIVPIAGGIGLVLLAVLALLMTLGNKRSQESLFYLYANYCLAGGLFLVSFSEVPREYLSLTFAGYLHFALRVLFDWSLFELVHRYFKFPEKLLRWGRPAYILVLLTFCIQYILNEMGYAGVGGRTGFDGAFIVMRLAFPLLVLPMAMGFSGALVQKGLIGRRTFLVAFSLLLPMQISDILVFHQVHVTSYFVKSYPFFIGIIFLWALLELRKENWRRLFVLEQESEFIDRFRGKAAQVAHDIRSPLMALDTLKTLVGKKLPESQRLLLSASIDRIQGICNELTQKPTIDESQRVEVLPCVSVLQPIVTEKQLNPVERMPKLSMEISKSAYDAFVKVNEHTFKRVISNVIDNAIQATQKMRDGSAREIVIKVSANRTKVMIQVNDNGCGICPSRLESIFEKGVSHGKKTGSGLGLYHAKQSLIEWKGDIRIESEPGKGARVFIELPKSVPPNWYVGELSMNALRVVVLDDDPSIHQVWESRLVSFAGKILHFYSAHELHKWLETENTEGILFLLDYELIGETMTGLTLIEEYAIGPQSVLVTSHNSEGDIRERCQKASVKILPKSLAPYVPIHTVH